MKKALKEKLKKTLEYLNEKHPQFVRIIKHKDISYLTRIILFKNSECGIYIHFFHLPDKDRHLHDHPWAWASSLHLWGHYNELLKDGKIITRKAGQFRKFKGSTFHKITSVSTQVGLPCITLFSHGPLIREWGFWDNELGKKIPWHEYLVREKILSKEEVERLQKEYDE